MLYQSHKAEVEALKYLVETDNVSGGVLVTEMNTTQP